MSAGLKQHRLAAQKAYREGRFLEALTLQIDLVNQHRRSGLLVAADFSLLGACFYAHGDLPQGYVAMREAYTLDPDSIGNTINLAIFANRLGRHDEARALAEQITRDAPHLDAGWSMLAHIYPLLGREDEARQAGLRCLQIKDEEAKTPEHLPSLPEIPRFAPHLPHRNIIAFSLWGDIPRYTDGLLRNVRLARDIYDSWLCRVYLDASVPAALREQLTHICVQVVEMPPPRRAFEGLFWRFQVADDPGIDRFIIRDADALVNPKERVAVDDWIRSGKHFHVMRDHWGHTEPVLAGMWGGVRGALVPVQKEIETFWTEIDGRLLPDRAFDQLFLRRKFWPLMRRSVCQHDAHYAFRDARPFPPFAARQNGIHIGQDHEVLLARFRRSAGKILPPQTGLE